MEAAQEIQQLSFDFNEEKPEISQSTTGEEALELKIGKFAGPLDLLLYLIKQEEADIFDIPVAKITAAYLQYLKLMQTLDITVAGDFLVMAATLIEIKSKMLLPRDPLMEGEAPEEDPRKELVDRLLEHQKFQSAAQMLWSRAGVEQAIFTRGRIETDEDNSEVNVGVFDLITVFQKILSRRKDEIEMEILREEKTLSQMIDDLRRQLFETGELNVNQFLLTLQSRREFVLAFMGILELAKEQFSSINQEKVFGDIILKKL